MNGDNVVDKFEELADGHRSVIGNRILQTLVEFSVDVYKTFGSIVKKIEKLEDQITQLIDSRKEGDERLVAVEKELILIREELARAKARARSEAIKRGMAKAKVARMEEASAALEQRIDDRRASLH